jgi:putative hemolysin
MEIAITLLIIASCLISEAFFSGSEIGVVSADRIHLRHEAAHGSRGAKMALKMLEKPEWLLSTTLVGTNVSVVTNTTLSTALAIELLGEEYSWVAIIVVAPLIWVFGEIVPKSIFQQKANTITPRVIFILRFASIIFYPILMVFAALARLLARIAGQKAIQNPFTLREEIVTMIEMSAAKGDILPIERRMIRRVFNFSETTVEEVMTPLIDVVGIEAETTCGKVRKRAIERAHKRLPVFKKRIDRIVGVINALDLLGEADDAPASRFVQEIRFVPVSKSIQELLIEMRETGIAMSVVVDEFGGSVGIVTIEDILEEVVGELEDEYDTDIPSNKLITKINDDEWEIGGRASLDDIEEKTGVNLVKGDCETMAGFIIELAKDIPEQGETLIHGEIELFIVKASAQAIQEVRMKPESRDQPSSTSIEEKPE